MHFVLEINSAGRDIKSVQALRRFLKGKLTDAGLEVQVVSTESHEFVVVSASTDRLEQEAHLLTRLERDTAFFFSRTDYGVETSRDNLDSITLREREQLLRSILNSIKITTDDLTTLRWQDVETHNFTVGDPLISAMFTHTNVFLSAFPLHDEEGCNMLRSQLLRFDCPSPTVVRAYCGSKVAIFVALLRSMMVWFAVLGVAALAAEVAIHIQGLSSVWAMLYGCLVPVWSALFLKYWRRRDATLMWEWDFGKLKNDVHLMRWHLRGEQRMFQATNKASLFRLSPAIKRHLAVSVPLVTSLLLPSTVFMLVSLNLEGKLSDSSPWHWPRVVNFGKQHLALDQAMPRILVSGAQSAVLYFVNRVYSKYSYAITKWEGWHTEEEFGGSLALKRLPFELATMLISPLIHVVWGADPLTLRHELIGIMLGDTASRLLTEVAWPVLYAYFISKYAVPAKQRTAEAATDADRAMATRVLRESQLPKLEFFDCYCFLIRYYIIATCFASVFPLGTVLITAILYSEAKICVFLMTRCRQRIPSMRATSIGIWFDVLRFVSALCITCNVILQAHTTTQLTANFGHTALIATAGAFGAGFAVEQILRLVGWLISVLVPDVPPRVRDSGKGREKKEAAKRRWADIHSNTTAKTEGGTGATQATRRAAVAEMSARGDLLPSLQG